VQARENRPPNLHGLQFCAGEDAGASYAALTPFPFNRFPCPLSNPNPLSPSHDLTPLPLSMNGEGSRWEGGTATPI